MMSDTKNVMGEQEVVKEGVCYMCTMRCPIKVRVHQGRATQIGMVD